MGSGYTDPNIDQIFDLTNTSYEALEIEPIWANGKLTNKKGDYEALRKWLTDGHAALIDNTRQRANTQIRNLAIWLGLHYKSQTPYADFRDVDSDEITVDTHKVVVNNIYDVERNRHSKITRNIPQTRPVPRTAEYQDYSGAKIAGAVLQTAKERVRQRKVVNRMVRESFIFGEAWCFIGWNKDKGAIDPRWEKAAEKLARKNAGPAYINVDGEKIYVDPTNPIYIGDHELRTILPWMIFQDPQTQAEDVEWVVEIKYQHIEVLKKLYPSKAGKIIATDNARVFNTDLLAVQVLKNHCLTYTVHGKSTRFLKDGVRFVCTPDVMLEAPEENPYLVVDDSEWGNLPCERLVDIEVPGRFHGHSTIQILASLQHSENQMHTMIKHYLMLLGHPKMIIPREGEIDIDELSDGSMIINVTGGHKPELMVPTPISPQIVAFAEMLRERIQRLGDLHGVSSGDLPNNVKAARAIRLLQELEDLRATSSFEKYNDLYLSIDRKLLSHARNYRPTDGRLIQILGRGNEYLIEDFDPEIFARNYDMKLELNGMMPQPPSARTEFILNAQQLSGGTLFTNEKLTKLLGFESEKEFIDDATVSVIKADRENDLLSKGKSVKEPMEHENHLVELREHMIPLRSISFQNYPTKVQEMFLDHVLTHEMFLWDHMQLNPAFQQYMLQNEPWFPMVYKQPKGNLMPGMGSMFQAPAMPLPEGAAQGQIGPTEQEMQASGQVVSDLTNPQ